MSVKCIGEDRGLEVSLAPHLPIEVNSIRIWEPVKLLLQFPRDEMRVEVWSFSLLPSSPTTPGCACPIQFTTQARSTNSLKGKNEGRGIKEDMKTNWSPNWGRHFFPCSIRCHNICKFGLGSKHLMSPQDLSASIAFLGWFVALCWFVAFDTLINHKRSFCSRDLLT